MGGGSSHGAAMCMCDVHSPAGGANSGEQASGIQDGRERKAQVLGALGVRPGLGSGSRAHF